MTPAPGYSGKPLAAKLGILPGVSLLPVAAPTDYRTLLGALPPTATFVRRAGTGTDIAHLFVTRRAELARRLAALRKVLRPDAVVWVSWPKKASGTATDCTEDTIREVALPMGWVDVKVCAVSEVWSGLKLVVRKTLR